LKDAFPEQQGRRTKNKASPVWSKKCEVGSKLLSEYNFEGIFGGTGDLYSLA